MVKPYANDLRERVVDAVADGASCRAAAQRFGVAASTAITWVQLWRQTGSVRPRPQGGDHRSHRLEAHAAEILALVEAAPDVTLAEIADHLRKTCGLVVAPSTIWRLLDRHGMSFKKKPHTPASSSGLTSGSGVGPGSTARLIWSPTSWSSSTRPARRPRWPGVTAGPSGASVAGPRCPTAIGRPRPSQARSGWAA